MNYYSKATGEYINTVDPADWMGRTDKPVPEHDPAVSSAIFNEGLDDWEVVFAEPLAPVVPAFSVREFRDRFTRDEQIAIRAASLNEMEVGLVYDDFQAAQYINITDPAVAAGIDLYIAKGLLEPHRKAELLALQPIE